jgi:hypothetical protein
MTGPILQLARVESGRMLRNPVLYLALIPVALWVRDARHGEADSRLYLLTGYGSLLPGLVLAAIVALAVLRGRYEGTDELLDSLAVGPDRRSIAHAVSAASGGLAMLVVLAATMAAIPSAFDASLGQWTPWLEERIDVPSPNLAQLLQGPVATVAVLAFVVALVRWIPSWLVLGPLAFLVLVQGLIWGMWHGKTTEGGDWLWPLSTGVVSGDWVGCAPEDSLCELPVSGFDSATPWWHLGYLAALAVFFGSVAVVRHRRDRSTWTWAAISFTIVVVLALAQIASYQSYTGTRYPGVGA